MMHPSVTPIRRSRPSSRRVQMHRLEGHDGHRLVARAEDLATGLKAIIAVHSMALGPGAGGCRILANATQGEAIAEALILSREMTYKNALADVGLGGAKAVLYGAIPEDEEARAVLFRSFGKAVNTLSGRYVTAEDVGVGVDDIREVARETRYVCGLTEKNGIGGDPALFTARGVIHGMRAALQARHGIDSLKGLRVAVQGLGNVGTHLCRLLADDGAHLVVGDLDEGRVEQIRARFGATVAPAETILMQDVDVVAPCATGGVVTALMAANIRARVIAGAANNQLAGPEVEQILLRRGILFAPDYVINAGGIIMVAAEYRRRFDPTHVRREIERIGERAGEIFLIAERRRCSPVRVANEMAERLFLGASHGGQS